MFRLCMHSATRRPVNFSRKSYCSEITVTTPLKVGNVLGVALHRISYDQAAAKFSNYDAARYFRPDTAASSPVVLSENPLKKVLLPFYGVDVETTKIQYWGEYGVERSRIKFNSKGQVRIETETDWYPTSGKLTAGTYTDADAGLREHAGAQYDYKLMNEAFSRIDAHGLTPYDPELVDPESSIDPFLVPEEAVSALFKSAINDYTTQRALDAIYLNHRCSSASVTNLKFGYEKFKIKAYLLPAYVLQYPGQPPRIMPALSHESSAIFGPNPISPSKAAGVALILFGAAAMLAGPQFALAARALTVVAGTSSVGLWNRYGPQAKQAVATFRVERRVKRYASLHRTEADKLRQSATETHATPKPKLLKQNNDLHQISEMTPMQTEYTEAEQEQMLLLGLDPKQPLTENDVHKAFNDTIKKVHPDLHRGYQSEEACKVIAAMRNLLQKFS